ncbi:MAG: redoxin domain-containing protein [Planctomycetaceae bacterium]
MRISILTLFYSALAIFSCGDITSAANLSFTARTVTGESIHVGKNGTDTAATPLTVVCFLGAECPMARIYGPRLTKLADEFRERGVQVIGVNSNRQDSFGDIKRYVDELHVTFPFVHDKDNVIADQFGATRTPEVFLLNQQLEVLYHGRIDDQYEPGVNRAAPKRQDLHIAITEALAEKPVTIAKTTALGCVIGRVRQRSSSEIVQNDITYSKHVVPVLQQHCVECHRAGEIGPFAMDSYGEVAGWADTMLETIDNGRMPPWHADPDHGSFQNSRHMPDADKQILRDWIAGGLKKGDDADLPEPVQYVDGWQLEREPDQIIEMRNRPFMVPADGVVEYQYFVVDPGFTEDKWITAAQVVPGCRAVVHHAIVFVRPPDGARFRGVGWLGAYVPGQRMIPLPKGRARKIPAGSKFVFQMHYTPNGRIQEDTTQVGLLFGNEDEVTHELYTLMGIDQEFEIPPGADHHVVKASVPWLPEHGELLAATPHMHYRGKSFRLLTDDNHSQPLLNVPNYDFNWQHTYVLQEPIPLNNIDTLSFEAVFDNSAGNPFNPDPSEWVTWGDQTWEEMAVAFFEVAEPRQKPATNRPAASEVTANDRQRQQKIDAYLKRAYAAMDTDGDGIITKGETAIIVRHFGHFGNFDRDGDGIVTDTELRELAERIYR